MPAARVVGVVGAGTMGSGIAQLAAAAGARTLLLRPRRAGACSAAWTALATGSERWAVKGARRRGVGRAALDRAPPPALDASPPATWSSRPRPSRSSSSASCSPRCRASSPRARAGHQHLVDPDHRDRRRRRRPRARRRHALLQPGAGHGARGGDRRRCRLLGRGAGAGARHRRGDGQARHRRRRRPGLPGQPLRRGRSGSRRCGCCRSGWPTSRRSTASCRLGGGFRMGPFELQDLVGLDIGLEVAQSFCELSFGEPRWRPSPLSARMVAAGRHGPQDGARLVRLRRRVAPPRRGPAAAGARRRRRPGGRGPRRPGAVADELRDARTRRPAATCASRSTPRASRRGCSSTAAATRRRRRCRAGRGRAVRRRARSPRCDPGGAAAGFHALPPLDACGLVELTRTPRAPTPLAAERTRGALHRPGLAHRLGRRRPRARARAHRLPARQRGGLRRRARASAALQDIDAGHGARPQPPARPAGLGRRDRPRPRARRPRRAAATRYREERYRAAPLLRRLVARGSTPRRRVSRGLSRRRCPTSRVRRPRVLPRDPPRSSASSTSTATTCGASWSPRVGRDAADDCFQETFLAALRAYPRLRDARTRAPGC